MNTSNDSRTDKMDSSNLQPDALPYYSATINTTQPTDSQILDSIITRLDIDDYRSLFFLLMDFIGPRNFLHFVRQNTTYLRDKFKEKYFEFKLRNVMLIEIFGTMQRYDLLKVLGTCEHVFLHDKDLNQISQLWKCLYSLCDQLTDSDVRYYKEKLFPELLMDINCAEELLCCAFVKNIFTENDLNCLKELFKDRLDCLSIIYSYTGASRLSYYPMKRPTRNSHCGVAVIINIEKFQKTPDIDLPERTGSHKDAESLKKMWESFGFLTEIFNNLTYDQVLELFRKLSSLDHRPFTAFVACYLSHGDENIVFSSDSQKIEISVLMDTMANKCPTLIDKPKLFFIQACSGQLVQQGVGLSPEPMSSTLVTDGQKTRSSLNTPLYSDILLFCATFPGFVSYRTTTGTSWFVSELVQAMEEFGEELTIANIVTKVIDGVSKKTGGVANTEFTNCKQIPICYKTLKYELKFKKALLPLNSNRHLESLQNQLFNPFAS